MNNCLRVLLNGAQEDPHDALADAIYCKNITKEAASRMGYGNINAFFNDHPNLLQPY